MMNEKEIERLKFEKSAARMRCKEVFGVICELERMLTSFEEIHLRWSNRYKAADLKLAKETKKIIRCRETKRLAELSIESLTPEQARGILEILERNLLSTVSNCTK